ncbi:proline-serine-threonine phosphatase-interacting protein 2 isoform X1 [Taeniopygia guttata]|uniref:proline-serine-threonine phosphatase-interacting protein 2 isoform X1 n=1 Tax=Taeniopygia guttata TaxID=59729 RepID=UPI003BB86A34
MGLSHGALIPSLPSPPAPPACCSTSRSSTRGHPGAGAPVRGRRLRGPGRAGPGAAECGGGGSRMREARFRDNFWSTDLTSTVGYDSIIQHLNDGRKNCKEFEDFLKERAIIEEKYGKELINLSKKKPCGQTELNTLKRSLDVFKQQVDNVGQGHIQLAQTLREEAKKMEDFREKQKLHRKKIELIMEAIHKNRNLQYKKTMEAKRLYEQRCRDKDEAEQAVHRNANLVTQKQQEKLFLKLAQTKSALEDTDRSYQQCVTTMEKIRDEWQNEHIKACEFFETQECERINYFRNALWLHVNQLSLGCVQNDEKYEEIRKSLEMCSIEKDVDFFVNLRKTGSLAPAPVVYENYYNAQRNVTPVRSPAPVPIPRRGPLPTPTSAPGEPDYATVDGYSLVFQKAEDTVGLTSVVEMAFSVIPRHTEMKCFCFSREYLRTTIIICTFRKCLLKIYAGDQQTPWMDLHIPGRKGPDAGIICVRKRF